MDYERLHKYLNDGGTDMQYVLEAIAAHCPDDETGNLVVQLFENIENA
jgi:hypothetical protein